MSEVLTTVPAVRNYGRRHECPRKQLTLTQERSLSSTVAMNRPAKELFAFLRSIGLERVGRTDR